MNNYLIALVLALAQGLTEFLPVSSSGHLILLERVGVTTGGNELFFNLMLHLGTLLSVCVYYRKTLIAIFHKKNTATLLRLILATIPTVVFGFAFRYVLPKAFLDGAYLPLCFMLTALLLAVSENARRRELTNGIAVIAGIAQGFAVLPGLSRSGTTICALRLCGVDKESAADFSFLMSVPVILGATIVEGAGLVATDVTVLWGPTLFGTAVAFASGLLAIRFFVAYVKRRSLLPFAIYTATLALLLILSDLGILNLI